MVLCMSQPGPIPDESGEYPPFFIKNNFLLSWENVLDMLDEQGLIDPGRVGITGLSMGVDAIAYGLHRTGRFSAAAVSGLSSSGPMGYFFGDARSRQVFSDLGLGRPGTEDDYNWKEMNLGLNAHKVSTPILVQSSDGEMRFSWINYTMLKEDGPPIDMYVFRDEHHIKWHPRNKKAVAVRAVDWMKFWLKGEEDADPAKAEQYKRWRELREQHEANLRIKSQTEAKEGLPSH